MLPPVAPAVYDSEGNLNWENGTFSNPLAELQKKYQANTSTLISHGLFEYKPISGLLIKAGLGYSRLALNEIQSNPLSSYNPFVGYTAADSYTEFANKSIETWIIEPQAEYRISFALGQLTALIGATFQGDKSELRGITASGFSNDGLIENIAAASSIRVSTNSYSQYRYNAIFGRLNYNYQNKYLLNLTGEETALVASVPIDNLQILVQLGPDGFLVTKPLLNKPSGFYLTEK